MSMSLTVHGSDFDARLRAKQDEVAATAMNAGRSFTQSMAELSQMQQAEILRLQAILRDSTALPERYPASVAIGSVAGQNGILRHVLLAVASDKSLWMLEDYTDRGRQKWKRVPPLPQAADEIDQVG